VIYAKSYSQVSPSIELQFASRCRSSKNEKHEWIFLFCNRCNEREGSIRRSTTSIRCNEINGNTDGRPTRIPASISRAPDTAMTSQPAVIPSIIVTGCEEDIRKSERRRAPRRPNRATRYAAGCILIAYRCPIELAFFFAASFFLSLPCNRMRFSFATSRFHFLHRL